MPPLPQMPLLQLLTSPQRIHHLPQLPAYTASSNLLCIHQNLWVRRYHASKLISDVLINLLHHSTGCGQSFGCISFILTQTLMCRIVCQDVYLEMRLAYGCCEGQICGQDACSWLMTGVSNFQCFNQPNRWAAQWSHSIIILTHRRQLDMLIPGICHQVACLYLLCYLYMFCYSQRIKYKTSMNKYYINQEYPTPWWPEAIFPGVSSFIGKWLCQHWKDKYCPSYDHPIFTMLQATSVVKTYRTTFSMQAYSDKKRDSRGPGNILKKLKHGFDSIREKGQHAKGSYRICQRWTSHQIQSRQVVMDEVEITSATKQWIYILITEMNSIPCSTYHCWTFLNETGRSRGSYRHIFTYSTMQ